MRPRGQIFALWDSDKDRTKKRAGEAKNTRWVEQKKTQGGWSKKKQGGQMLAGWVGGNGSSKTYHEIFNSHLFKCWMCLEIKIQPPRPDLFFL